MPTPPAPHSPSTPHPAPVPALTEAAVRAALAQSAGLISVNGQKIIGCAAPEASGEAATWDWVLNLIQQRLAPPTPEVLEYVGPLSPTAKTSQLSGGSQAGAFVLPDGPPVMFPAFMPGAIRKWVSAVSVAAGGKISVAPEHTDGRYKTFTLLSAYDAVLLEWTGAYWTIITKMGGVVIA